MVQGPVSCYIIITIALPCVYSKTDETVMAEISNQIVAGFNGGQTFH